MRTKKGLFFVSSFYGFKPFNVVNRAHNTKIYMKNIRYKSFYRPDLKRSEEKHRILGITGCLVFLFLSSGTLLAAKNDHILADDNEKDISFDSSRYSSWQNMLNSTCPSVVSLHMNFPRAFEETNEGCSQATGFVVDAKNGIILTNRHVVGTGPVGMEALFINGEKLPVQPLYRDPVHDFAFVQFDPSKLEYIKPRSIPLKPEKAFVGQELRVIGNNAGEKLTISSGTLARLDRNAPNYGKKSYNDFNTFYLQSASSTTGGSSGSPVVDIEGDCIGLNAGGKVGASNAFYLPLDRVKRALDILKSSEASDITRGTIETTFIMKSFTELRRLGLPTTIEEEYRQHLSSKYSQSNVKSVYSTRTLGLLVLKSFLPEGPSAQANLRPGDILLKLNSKLICDFIDLEQVLDNCVHDEVEIEVLRNGEVVKTAIKIENLHDISPQYYFEVSGSIFHEVGYQMARNSNLKVKNSGVVLARAGYLFSALGITSRTIITEINGQKVDSLFTFMKIYHALAEEAESNPDENQKINFRIALPSRDKSARVMTVEIEKKWHDEVFSVRNSRTGEWNQYRNEDLKKLLKSMSSEPNDVPLKKESRSVNESKTDVRSEPVKSLFALGHTSNQKAREIAEKVQNSLVEVRFVASHKLDGNSERSFLGGGLILDRKEGLILTDRDSVTTVFGIPKVKFGNFCEIPAEIKYFHPVYNLAILQYDVNHPELKDLPLEEVKFFNGNNHVTDIISDHVTNNIINSEDFNGKDIYFVGLSWKDSGNLYSSLEGLSGNLKIIKTEPPTHPVPPKFKGTQFDRISFSKESSNLNTNGVYLTEEGRVLGFQCCFPVNPDKKKREFWWGVPSNIISKFLTDYKSQGTDLKITDLGVTLKYINLTKAKNLKCPERYLNEAKKQPSPEVLLAVKNTWAGVAADKKIKNDDILLEINSESVFSYEKVFKKIQNQDKVNLTILRNENIEEIEIETVELSNDITDKFIQWQGCTLQKIHNSAIEQGVSKQETEIYIASRKYGSPAQKYGLYPTMRITEINGKKVKTLEDFEEIVTTLKDKDSVVIRAKSTNDVEVLLTLVLDLKFFPTVIAEKKNEAAKFLL